MNRRRKEKELHKRLRKAEKIVNDKSKMDHFLRKLECKLKGVPKIGDKLSNIITLIFMVKSYVAKEYTEVPIATIISIVAVLIYFLSPLDTVPDFIPIFGYWDDAAMVGFLMVSLDKDISDYLEWRDKNRGTLL